MNIDCDIHNDIDNALLNLRTADYK